MSDKFMWTKADTSLLISLWSDDSVQKQLRETPRNVAIWNGVARYMKKRGISVNALQCRQRIKRLMGRYRKIKRGEKLKLKNTADLFFHELDFVVNNKSCLANLEGSSNAFVISNDDAYRPVQTLKKKTPSSSHQAIKAKSQQVLGLGLGLQLKHKTELETTTTRPRATKHMPSKSSPISVEVVGDIDLDSSHNNVNPPQIFFETEDVSISSDQEVNQQHATVHLVYNSKHTANPTGSGNQRKDPNYLVTQAIAAQSDTITNMLLAQAETTQRLLEGDRKRQERLESRIDNILDKLEQIIPSSTENIANKLEAKVDRVLNKLGQVIPLHMQGNANTLKCNLESKMQFVLERLEHMIPIIEHNNLSIVSDKIDHLLTGLDKVAPYAFDSIEISTEEKVVETSS